jgi:hypothetical protein
MIFKPKEAGGLSYILVPQNFDIDKYPYDLDIVNDWEPIHDHDKVQEYLQRRNIRHSCQAQGTPFTIPPLDKLNWQADSVQAKEILSGTIPLSFLTGSPCVEKVLQYMADRPNLPEIDTYITTEQVAKGFRKWRETTST